MINLVQTTSPRFFAVMLLRLIHFHAIAVTAHAIKGEAEAILAAGVTVVVTKPIDEALLLRAIRSGLRGDSLHG
jgi:CheY-like chemotaxis protein